MSHASRDRAARAPSPSVRPRVLLLDPADNVAVALTALPAGERVDVAPQAVTVRHSIPFGHKLAIRTIRARQPVVKYNEVIGYATADIAPGEHVHVHNVESGRLPGPA